MVFLRAAGAFCLALCLSCHALAGEKGISARQYLDFVKHLSAKDMRGRGTGTPELDRAADYIAREFRKAGLRPFEGTSYFQSFPVSVESSLGQENRFQQTIAGVSTALVMSKDFTPLGFSGTGSVEAGIVFAGYGGSRANDS